MRPHPSVRTAAFDAQTSDRFYTNDSRRLRTDRQEETGQNLCDTDMLDIVRMDEEGNSDNKTPDSDAFQPDVTLKEDQSSLQTLISFFKQTTAGEISENKQTALWKISQQLRKFFFFQIFISNTTEYMSMCTH